MPPEPPKMLRSVKLLRTLRLRLAMQMPCEVGQARQQQGG